MHKRNMIGVFFVSMFLLSVLMINVSNVNAVETTVSVQPSSQTVGQESFVINATVQDVEDLISWQIVLYYNPTLLSTRPDLITVPTENIFKDQDFLPVGPFIDVDSQGTYIFFGAALLGEVPGVTGSGVLCQINFTGQASGTSELNLGIIAQREYQDQYTQLLNSNQEEISISIVDGEVTVTGIEQPREQSTITIKVNPSKAVLGSNVLINGTINPPRAEVNVTIYYSRDLGTSGKLATVQTDESSSYEYNWTPEETGTYTFWARWPGDADYREDSSDVVSVTVHPPPPPPPPPKTDMTLYYVIAAIAIIAIATIGIYFTKIRKRQQATD